jgi:hypothetical protein
MLIVLVGLVACVRAPYPAPAPRAATAPELPRTGARDDGDEARVRELERQCRTRLSGETAEAALVALDRVREVLGSGCHLETVAHDPLHWRLRCRADALFRSGQYQLARTEGACAEMKGTRVHPWICVGAVLRGLAVGSAALAKLQVGVVGHVDDELLKPGSTAHVCSELHAALGFSPRGRWEQVSDDAPDEERWYANNQLAWCRAANVVEHVRRGLGDGASGPAENDVETAVVGMGAGWLASRKDGVCPSHGESRAVRPDCPEARRVDVLLRFSPRAEVRYATCKNRATGTEAALACLEDCLEQLALGTSADSGVAAEAAPLFVDGQEARDALPAGWYVQRVPATEGRRLALGRLCDVLGVVDPMCAKL